MERALAFPISYPLYILERDVCELFVHYENKTRKMLAISKYSIIHSAKLQNLNTSFIVGTHS